MTIELDIACLLLLIHYIADFKFQSHWMATNKSKSWLALSAHVLVYSLMFSLTLNWQFVVINGILHFITDAITSRMSSKLFGKNWHDFFEVIGGDQYIHTVTLLTTWVLLN